MTGAHRTIGGLLAVTALLLTGSAAAEPVDLSDPTPRWIQVSFENSPADRPGQRSAVWSPPMPAWLQRGSHEGWVVIAIPPDVVEQVLLVREHPVPGSFGPFVWILDARTGHVLAAELEGAVRRHIGMSFVQPRVRAEIRVEMGTERDAGFRPARSFLGQRIHDICEPGDDGCTAVPAVAYDRATGYVNAVGVIEARALGFETHSFCSLGEVRFSERGSDRMLAVSSGPP